MYLRNVINTAHIHICKDQRAESTSAMNEVHTLNNIKAKFKFVVVRHNKGTLVKHNYFMPLQIMHIKEKICKNKYVNSFISDKPAAR
jgi:hypothetical protein